MPLPTSPLPTSTVAINGTEVEIKSLSRSQALHMRGFVTDIDGAENYLVACGTGVSEEEAREWRNSVDVATAGLLVDAIVSLSGLGNTEEVGSPLAT